ncbi:type II and III secretion system protein family protein [Xylophilus sp.]|uniref:type II and III secretion system protein family protein n=1 Tax=Xylophilus sp. TaxID=2653893 RepID=UPI0013BAC96A|nr:pilus assembly protein N-terminal domain-containing protein [Xylophilus sp.]KAF1046394.1 MAG: Type II secretion system protein D [Xylophilus sp.]
MPIHRRSTASPFAARPAAAAGLLCAVAALAAAPAAAAIPLSLTVGTPHELTVEAGLERIAIGDESVASVTLTRARAGQPAARVLITPLAGGSTTLLLWPRGGGPAQVYALTVARRVQRLDAEVPGLPAHQEALAEAGAARAKDDLLFDRSRIALRSSTVQVDVRVVEFSKSVLHKAGLNLFSTATNRHGFSFGVLSPGGASNTVFGSGGALDTANATPLSQAFSLLLNFGRADIGLNLQLLESNNLARVLAAPTLVTLSGQSANFLAGGEIPIPTSSTLGATSVQWKKFGIGLTVSPTVLADDRIVLKVAPEASELDYTNAVTTNSILIPAIKTRQADTTVELGDGESFVIGGLVSRNTASGVDKVPLLGDLPVLGPFFKRLQYQQDERELVFVVTPRLVQPLARGTPIDAQLPGARSEQRDGPVWRSYLLGAQEDAVPGFSR